MLGCERQLNNRSQIALALALLFLVFGIISGLTDFWMPGGYSLLPSGSYAFLPAGLALIYALFYFKFSDNSGVRAASKFVLAGPIVISFLFISDWLCRSYNFFQGPSIRGEIILLAIVSAILLRKNLFTTRLVVSVLSLTILGGLYCFLQQSQGRVIFSDDHSMFMYRLQLLVQAFPNIPFYNPEWNAGLDARDPFATGALSLFILGLPWIYLFPVEHVYNYIIIWVVLFQLPVATGLATWLAGFGLRAASLSGILVLSGSLHWYRWALKYGTMGFVTGATLLALAIILAALIVSQKQLLKRWSFAFISVLSLCLLWPFFGVVLLPLILFLTLFFVKHLFFKEYNYSWRRQRLLWVGVLLLALNLPWMTIFIGTSGLDQFLTAHKPKAEVVEVELPIPQSFEQYLEPDALQEENTQSARRFKHASGNIDLALSLKMVRKVVFAANPLLIFFGLLGVFILKGHLRWLYVAQLGWLFLLGAILFPIKPQLELDRLLILGIMLLALPAGVAIDRLITLVSGSCNWFKLVPSALVCGFLLTGPLLVFSVLKNRSTEHYVFSSEMVADFRNLLESYQPQGRILFAGCVIHEFGGGHLAPLAHFSGHPMIASSHAHTLWWYKDVFPPQFLARGDRGKAEYMELYNVSDIFAHEVKYKKYFRSKPNIFELIWSGHGFDFFRIKNFNSDYFLEGQGQVLSQSVNSVKLKVESDPAVISFRYNPALEAGSCSLEPWPVYKNMDFIKLTGCAGKEVQLKAKSSFNQLLISNRKSF